MRATSFRRISNLRTTFIRRWQWGWSIMARTVRRSRGIGRAIPSRCFSRAIDVDFGKNWEFNFGVGVGVTQATDHLLVKAIVGYRFNNNKN